MLCHCKEFCFTYEAIKKINDKKCGVYRINKCGIILMDSKKKKKCDFFQEMFIKEFIIENIKKRDDLTITYKKNKPDYLSQLNWYINLYEIVNDINIKQGVFENFNIKYIKNINYFLNIMQYKLFFDDKETIESLKIRLKRPPDNKKVKEKNIYPIVCIDIPEYLKHDYKHKNKKKKMYKPSLKSLIKPDQDIFEKLDETEKELDPLNKNENSDDEDEEDDEEEEKEEEGGFDIDDYVSENEDSCGDEGEFSD